jgi:hypothetical protein
MTEDEWLTCADPRLLMEFLRKERQASRTQTGKRKLRLFACACVRGIEHLLRQEGSQQALRIAEAYADGEVGKSELATADQQGRWAVGREDWEHEGEFWQAAEAATHLTSDRFDPGDRRSVAHASSSAAHANALCTKQVESHSHFNAIVAQYSGSHAVLLRDIFGNPFRPVAFDPAWRTDTAVSLARGMYDAREFSAMPILADALQDAGCEDEAILAHCRDANQVHVRGCWVCDLVLGFA